MKDLPRAAERGYWPPVRLPASVSAENHSGWWGAGFYFYSALAMLYVTFCTPNWKYKFPAIKQRNSRRKHLQDASLLNEVQAGVLHRTAEEHRGAGKTTTSRDRHWARSHPRLRAPVPGDPRLSREREGKGAVAAALAPSARCCLEWRGCCAPGWEKGADVAEGFGRACAPQLPAAAPEP